MSHTYYRRLVLSALLAAGFTMFTAAHAEPAFDNANFERGTFTNWVTHEGWTLQPGMENSYALQLVNHPVLFGNWTAQTAFGNDLAKRYTGKALATRGSRLVSAPFAITKPFLTFFFVGNLGRDGTCVGVDIDGDETPDVVLQSADLKTATQRIGDGLTLSPAPVPLYRVALDLSNQVGRTGRFVAVANAGERLYVDDLRQESGPPAWATLTGAQVTNRAGRIDIRLDNPFAHETQARLHIQVLDELGAVVQDTDRRVDLTADPPSHMSVSFTPNASPHYRIRILALNEDGAAQQMIPYRVYAQEMREGRPFVAVEDGWEVTSSGQIEPDLPADDAAWKLESPVRPRWGYGYRFWPSFGKQNEITQVWYRRTFTLPGWFPGARTYLRLTGGGSGLLGVIVNGRVVHEQVIWQYADYAFDITDALQRDGVNELMLRFRNCDRYLKVGQELLEAYEKYHHVRYGVLGNLRVESRPTVNMDRVLVDSYYRERRLAARVRVRNQGGETIPVRVEAALYDAEKRKAFDLGPVTVDIPAGESRTVTLDKLWENPIAWTLSAPNLLRLSTTITAGRESETVHTRFGFREIWTQGKRVYLNDWPIRVFEGTMTLAEDLEASKWWWGQNADRSLRIGWETAMTADEVGVLVKGVWEDHYPPLDPPKDRYWGSFATSQVDRVQANYNHPAVWLWAVGNELGGHGQVRQTGIRDAFIPRYTALMHDLMSLDPQRPVVSHGEGDFFGLSSIWAVHYPHEYGYAYDHPNDAHILSLDKNIMVWGPHPPYLGDKPVYLGEAFSGGNLGPDWLAAIGSSAVYTQRGVFDTWREWFIERQRAYREDEITGWEPFDVFSVIHNFYPIEVYPREYNRHFYAGAVVNRRIVIWNDTDQGRNLTLEWSFGEQSGSDKVLLRKGGAGRVAISLNMPKVAERTEIDFHVRLTQEGQLVAPRWGFWEQRYSIMPRAQLKGTVVTWGLDAPTEDMLRFFGAETVAAGSAEDLKGAAVLFLTDDLLETGRPEAQPIRNWVAGGGLAFVFTSGKDNLVVPLKLHTNPRRSTHAWPIAQDDPLMKGIGPDDLSFWGSEDFRVAHHSFLKPTSGAFRVLAETGDNSGTRLTPLLRAPCGEGAFILCSLLMADKYREEPVVGTLLANLLASAPQAPSGPGRTGTLLSDALTKRLADEGWVADDLAGLPDPKLAPYNIVWVDTEVGTADVDALKAYAENGGTLVLSRLTPDTIETYRPLLGTGPTLAEAPHDNVYGGELIRQPASPLLDGLSNFDLWWKRGVFGRDGPGTKVTSHPADFVIAGPTGSWSVMTQPAALAETPIGKGRLIVDQVRWDEGVDREHRAQRAWTTLLTNLGVPRRTVDSGVSDIRFTPIRLEANVALAREDIKGVAANPPLLAVRERALAGIPFDFSATNRVLMLDGTQAVHNLPRSVTIPVKLKATRLHFLQTSGLGYIDYDVKKPVMEYRIHLSGDGQTSTETVSVRYGEQLDDALGAHETLVDAEQVAVSDKDGLSAYRQSWTNPKPDAEIEAIDVVSMDTKILPVVLAITAETVAKRAKPEAASRRREGPWSATERRGEAEESGRVWAYIAPFPCAPFATDSFPAQPTGSFLEAFPPEKGIDLEGVYPGKNTRVHWKRFVEDFPKKPPRNYAVYIDRWSLVEWAPGETDTVRYTAYFYTKVYSPVQQKVILAFGSDDSSKVWLNGHPIHEVWMQRGTFLGQDCVVTTLNAGWNPLLVKVLNTFGDGAVAVDFKAFDQATVDAWKADAASLAGVPSLPLVYNAWEKKDRLDE